MSGAAVRPDAAVRRVRRRLVALEIAFATPAVLVLMAAVRVGVSGIGVYAPRPLGQGGIGMLTGPASRVVTASGIVQRCEPSPSSPPSTRPMPSPPSSGGCRGT